jgi:hypothetical protein
MRFFSLLTIALFGTVFLSSCSNKKKTASSSENDSTTRFYYEFHDFESVMDGRVDSTKGLSGKICGLLNDKIEYSYGFEKQLKQIPSFKNLDAVNISFSCWMDKVYPDDVFVISIDDTIAKKNILWQSGAITPAKTGEWSQANLTYKINKDFINPEYVMKLYIWNKGKHTFYFDDLSFSFVQKK